MKIKFFKELMIDDELQKINSVVDVPAVVAIDLISRNLAEQVFDDDKKVSKSFDKKTEKIEDIK